MKNLYLILGLGLLAIHLPAQWSQQFFDSNPPNPSDLNYILDTTGVWQVASPDKTLFSRAPTSPNALITDSLGPYPINSNASAILEIPTGQFGWFPYGIVAIQWVQGLDFENGVDGGMVEFRTSDTAQWENMFTSNYVYSAFGYNSSNVKTLANGQKGFTGIDSSSNVWLCLDFSWLQVSGADSIIELRFTLISDSVDTQQDGWMLDNFISAITGFHTINEHEREELIYISPNPTTGKILINSKKLGTLQYIESMELRDLSGKVVQRWGKRPSKFEIDISKQKPGLYILKVNSNIETSEFRVLLQP